MNQVQLEAENIKPNDNEEDKSDPDFEDMPWDAEGCKERMEIVNQYVSEVSALPLCSRVIVNLVVLNLKLIFSYSRELSLSFNKNTPVCLYSSFSCQLSYAVSSMSHGQKVTQCSHSLLLPSSSELSPQCSLDTSV